MTTGQQPPQQPYYPPAPPWPVHMYAPPQRKSRLAITSLILGILSLLCAIGLVGIAFAPVAIGLGVAGLHVTSTHSYLSGRDMAWVGIALGSTTMVLVAVLAITGSIGD